VKYKDDDEGGGGGGVEQSKVKLCCVDRFKCLKFCCFLLV